SSLLRALSKAFELGFDPLDCELAEPWQGPRPTELLGLSTDPWRTAGDARERLELYAAALVERICDGQDVTDLPEHADLALILDSLREVVAPRLDACGPGEMQGMLDALSGRFVPAGPSGAPSRGTLDVLPTGRNFFSADVRKLQ
ncbi:cobaltochelatase subunit CobN, partial [Pseudomonas viridiflava]|uniref:cobaltochelatase subunit CobN n=1 Tax=Pseudomonas viridiflava TaxID=33069 RepID=UPI00197E3C7E